MLGHVPTIFSLCFVMWGPRKLTSVINSIFRLMTAILSSPVQTRFVIVNFATCSADAPESENSRSCMDALIAPRPHCALAHSPFQKRFTKVLQFLTSCITEAWCMLSTTHVPEFFSVATETLLNNHMRSIIINLSFLREFSLDLSLGKNFYQLQHC